jgi:hypothetical protein
VADGQRTLIQALTGEDLSAWSDAELWGGVSPFNDFFPNFHPWGGWARIVFRFRPHGDNPEETLMDTYLLAPWPKDKPRPAPAKPRRLGFDDPWTMAPELLSLSKIIDQDVLNLPLLHRGVKAKSPPYVWLSAYQEMKIRNFHRIYEETLGLADDA